VLTFFGFIHGEAIGVGQSLTVAVSYLIVAGVLGWVAKFGTFSAPVPEMHHEEGIDAHGLPTAAAE
jgi:AGZA family xanthine/uracil permease-like MFS transporter